MKKAIELRKTQLGRPTREVISLAAIERVTILSEESIRIERANHKGSPLSRNSPSTMAAVLSKEKAGILRLVSGAELPLVDEELDGVLNALDHGANAISEAPKSQT